jgi:hypothetical protein
MAGTLRSIFFVSFLKKTKKYCVCVCVCVCVVFVFVREREREREKRERERERACVPAAAELNSFRPHTLVAQDLIH